MFTNAATLVTASPETAATASKAHWYFGTHAATITRRRLTSGLVRITITVEGTRGTMEGYNLDQSRTAHRDLTAQEAEALFVAQITKWDGFFTSGRGTRAALLALAA